MRTLFAARKKAGRGCAGGASYGGACNRGECAPATHAPVPIRRPRGARRRPPATASSGCCARRAPSATTTHRCTDASASTTQDDVRRHHACRRTQRGTAVALHWQCIMRAGSQMKAVVHSYGSSAQACCACWASGIYAQALPEPLRAGIDCVMHGGVSRRVMAQTCC